MTFPNYFYYECKKVLDTFMIPYYQVRNMVFYRFYFSRKLTQNEFVSFRSALMPFVRFIEFGDSFCSEYSKMVSYCEILLKNSLTD